MWFSSFKMAKGDWQRLDIHHSSVDRWIGRYEKTGGLEVIKLPGLYHLRMTDLFSLVNMEVATNIVR
jgi:hypothetical protein